MFRRHTKRISSFLLSAAMAITCVAPTFAESANAEVASQAAAGADDMAVMTERQLSEQLLATSVILKTGESYYMKNGEKKYFNSQNTAYTPKTIDGDIFVGADVISQIFDAESTYSKKTETFEFKKGEKTASIRVGEDAIYVNGEGKFIETPAEDNGTGKFIPMMLVAQALGYDVVEDSGITVLNDTGLITPVENPDLEDLSKTVEVSNDLTALPSDKFGNTYFPSCGFYDWGPQDGYVYADHTGYTTDVNVKGIGHSIYLEANPRSFSAWHLGSNARVVLDKDSYAIKATAKIKSSEDYANNRPVMFALWYKSNGVFFGSDFWYPEVGVNSEEWKDISIVLDDALIKKRLAEGATSVSIAFGTSYNGKDDAEATGKLYYGSIDINSYSQKSAKLKAAIALMDGYFSDYYFTTGFEAGENRPGIFDWGHTGLYSTKYSDDGSIAFEGKSCAVAPAVAKSYAGYQFQTLKVPEDIKGTHKSIEVSFYAKVSEDFNANVPFVSFNFMHNGTFMAQKGLKADVGNNISTEWSKLTFRMPYRYGDDGCWLPGVDYETFYPIIGCSASGVSDTNPATGEMYIDNVTVKYIDPVVDGSVEAPTYFTNNDVGLYQLGDTMNIKVKNADNVAQFRYFTADICDIDGKVVKTEKKDKAAFIESGFSYKPEQPGYYSIKIWGHNADGYSYTLADSYKSFGTDGIVDNASEKYGFVFTRGEAKPMEDRNDYLMISSSCFEGEETYEAMGRGAKELEVAAKLGYSGVRIHQVKWGSAPGDRSYIGAGFGDTGQRRVYNWSNVDAQVKHCTDQGFKRIVANIMGTPRWAVQPQYQNEPGYATGGWAYSLYAADDMTYVDEMIQDFTERYDGRVTGIEWYNEPYYGQTRTAFWYDSMEKFAEMFAAAGKAMKKYAPDWEFWGSGLLGATNNLPFWTEVLTSEYAEDLKETVDVISFHGTYSDMPNGVKEVAEYAGFGDKKLVNSEAYSYASGVERDPVTKERNFVKNSMTYLMHDFLNLKCGLDANCHFTVHAANTEYGKHGVGNATNWGFLRTFGRYELYPGASTVFAWNKLIGKECEYMGEYDYGDVKAVRFEQDGVPMIAFWNSAREEFAMPAELQGLLGGNTKLYDFELKDNMDVNHLQKDKVYYIVDIDKAKADALTYTDDAALSFMYEAPIYTAQLSEKRVLALDELNPSLVSVDNSAEKPFDEKTWKINENVEWITDGWKWNARRDNLGAPDGYEVKHAIHMDEDGLYILIDVKDSKYYQTAKQDTVQQIWMGDSVQIGFNANMLGTGYDTAECQLAMTPDGVFFYKQTCQDVGAMLPTGMTKAVSNFPADRSNIKQTSEGMTYFIFLPASELFPYTYGAYDYARVSLLVNNTDDDDGSQGYFEWGSGIGGTKSVEPYAVLKFPELQK